MFNLERSLLNYVTKEEQAMDMRDKVNLSQMDELSENLDKLKTIKVTMEENLTQKI